MKSLVQAALCALFLWQHPATVVAQTLPPVYVVLFTHIEDNVPVGTLGTQESRQNYLFYRGKLLAVGNLFLNHNVRWVFQPDWKFLLAALMYEDSTVIGTTNGKNLLRYMREDLRVAIDPHSHEAQGYNYTDVAHLLDSLGVGGSTVIGGHVWDPNLPQFQRWDRFRVPVAGSRYPWAFWRGDVLMGSGTPNHVNDPHISGVWRPKDRYHYFEDDTAGNIVAVGQYKGDVQTVSELIGLYTGGIAPPQYMLTASIHVKPATITSPSGLQTIEDSVLTPLVALRSQGKVALTDFTSLVNTWRTDFGARAYIYDPDSILVGVEEREIIPHTMVLEQNYPNPFNPSTTIRFSLPQRSQVTLKVFDVLGREVATLVDEEMDAGEHSVVFSTRGRYAFGGNAVDLPSGVYFYRMQAGAVVQLRKMEVVR
ncbi:MAG: hypothetical protein KatS3mg109_1732 [Pirellulaceae bacterium]|nr:MAG: hypothetical protein KatS3mg109_1732 [Pirellulaceae bacterium]